MGVVSHRPWEMTSSLAEMIRVARRWSDAGAPRREAAGNSRSATGRQHPAPETTKSPPTQSNSRSRPRRTRSSRRNPGDAPRHLRAARSAAPARSRLHQRQRHRPIRGRRIDGLGIPTVPAELSRLRPVQAIPASAPAPSEIPRGVGPPDVRSRWLPMRSPFGRAGGLPGTSLSRELSVSHQWPTAPFCSINKLFAFAGLSGRRTRSSG